MILFTVIGDVVGSRQHKDRRRLQRDLTHRLNAVNATLNPIQPLEVGIGDEFQGAFQRISDVSRATLLVRLGLLIDAHTDTRFGLGEGEITVFDSGRAPISQDGPGWWAARAAIDRAKDLSKQSRTSALRTCFGYTSNREGPAASGAFEAYLFCRDELVAQMNPRQQRLLLGLLLDCPQEQLAHQEGITQSAVSQALHRSGAFMIEAAERRLSEAGK